MSVEGGPRHLVLGGSTGIGFAYAERYARLGHRLVIVARDAIKLEAAREKLVRTRASSVETRCCDLTTGARQTLLDSVLQTPRFSTVFIGGPGPVAGSSAEICVNDHQSAREACVAYPCEVIDLGDRLLGPGGRFVILSSSAADEPFPGHRFYLSALYRRELDNCLATRAARLGSLKIDLLILKPKLVLTPLSESYASAIDAHRSPEDTLARIFTVPKIQTPTEFMQATLSGTV